MDITPKIPSNSTLTIFFELIKRKRTHRPVHRQGDDASDHDWCGLHHRSEFVAGVPDYSVERPVLLRRNFAADHRGGDHGLHGAGAEPPNVTPIRRRNEES